MYLSVQPVVPNCSFKANIKSIVPKSNKHICEENNSAKIAMSAITWIALTAALIAAAVAGITQAIKSHSSKELTVQSTPKGLVDNPSQNNTVAFFA